MKAILLASLFSPLTPLATVDSAWLGRLEDAPSLTEERPGEVSAWRPVAIKANPMGQVENQITGKMENAKLVTGALEFRGAFVLTSPDKAFGGFSGMRVLPGGGRVLAITDRGSWLEANVSFDIDGAISEITNGRMAKMMRHNGEEIQGLQGDAEALAITPDGNPVVSFERYHRIDFYEQGPDERMLFKQRIFHNRLTTKGLNPNGGLEGLEILKDGRVLTLAENTGSVSDAPDDVGSLIKSGERPGWISRPHSWSRGGDDWQPLAFRTAPEFSITDIAQDEQSGDLFILERAFSRTKGARARISRLAQQDLKPGTVHEGQELGRLNMLHGIDNMEAMDVRRNANGQLIIYLLSDDNFNLTQRTVLMSWAVSE